MDIKEKIRRANVRTAINVLVMFEMNLADNRLSFASLVIGSLSSELLTTVMHSYLLFVVVYSSDEFAILSVYK